MLSVSVRFYGELNDFLRVGHRQATLSCTLQSSGSVKDRVEAADARLGPPPQAEPRFLADVHLGRLAGYLRLAGLDTAYRNDCVDEELVAISASEDRTILTRDVGVLKHRVVRRGYFVRETRPA